MLRRAVLLLALAVLAAAGPAAAAKTPLPGFRSPSGNIKCLLLSVPTGNLLCSIGHADYASTLRKLVCASCEVV